MASTWRGETPLESKTRWITMAATTAVIRDVQIRKASLYLRAVECWNSKMKLQLILVLFHMNRLHPYMNKCKLSRANMLHIYKPLFSMGK